MDLLTLLTVAEDIGWFVAPVAGWLMVAGESGATKGDLVTALGVGEDEVSDALAMLQSHGCLVQDTGEQVRFKLQVQDYASRGRRNAEVLFPNSFQYRNPIGGIGTPRKMKKIKTTKNGPRKAEQFSGSLTTSVKPTPSKVKKIKTTGTAGFRAMVDADNKRIHGPGSGNRYIDKPSEYPILNLWRHKDNPNHWKALDWIGYWLHLFLKLYETEDPIFQGQRCHRPRTETDIYWEHGFQAIQLRDSSRGFRGDGAGLKEYLDWLFTDFLPAATWMNDPIMAKQAFRVRSNAFLDKFKVRSVKVKNKSSKPRGKWNPWGYSER